jgi:flagellar biosynthesis protein FlhG
MVNMAENTKLAEINFHKFREITMRFLDIKLHYVGMVPQSSAIRRSIVQRKPICVSQPKSLVAKSYEALAMKVIKTTLSQHDGVKFFNEAVK